MKIAFKILLKNGFLQKYIEANGLTQSDLARLLNIPLYKISNWINLKSYPKTDEDLGKIEGLLNIPAEILFPDEIKSKEFKAIPKQGIIYRELDALPLHELKQLPAPEYNHDISDLQELLSTTLCRLSHRTKKIIEFKLGLGCDPLSFADIGIILGMTRSRAAQIYHHGIRQLRALSQYTGLKKFAENYPRLTLKNPVK